MKEVKLDYHPQRRSLRERLSRRNFRLNPVPQEIGHLGQGLIESQRRQHSYCGVLERMILEEKREGQRIARLGLCSVGSSKIKGVRRSLQVMGERGDRK